MEKISRRTKLSNEVFQLRKQFKSLNRIEDLAQEVGELSFIPDEIMEGSEFEDDMYNVAKLRKWLENHITKLTKEFDELREKEDK